MHMGELSEVFIKKIKDNKMSLLSLTISQCPAQKEGKQGKGNPKTRKKRG